MIAVGKNSEYWAERFLLIENSIHSKSEEVYYNQVEAIDKAKISLDNSIEKWLNRIAINNELSVVEARKLLDKRELKEFTWTLDEYIKYGKENAVNQKWLKELENASARVHITRFEALKLDLEKRLEVLSFEQIGKVEELLKGAYKDTYFKGAYEIAKGTNKGLMLSGVDDDKLNKVIGKPWTSDGSNFSSRIWTQKNKMVNELHQELMKNIVLGKSPKESIKHMERFVDDKVKNKKNATKSLVYTETAYFSSLAQRDMFSDIDVEDFEVLSVLDSKTSEVCRTMDGKVFPLREFEIGVNAPPFHVRCRSITVPNYDREDEELGLAGELSEDVRVARGEDGKSYYVSSDIKYEEWYNKYVRESKLFDKKWLSSDFKSVKKFENHVSKHLREYDGFTKQDYLQRARQLLASDLSENIEGFIDKDGFVFKYDILNNDIAIGHFNGSISTLFKPETKQEYWLQQNKLFNNKGGN